MDFINYDYLEIVGTLVGLVYLYFEYKANRLVWVAGIIMPAIYIFIYYRSGLYADFGINIYYLLIAVYGYLAWTFGGKRKDKKELPISKIKLYPLLLSIIAFLVSFWIIALILINYTNSDVPWWDAFTTALSIVGLWMLARKYVEQWIAWILVDIVCVGLYIYKGLYFTSGLYALYTIVAIFGYFKWLKLMHYENSKSI